jgi:hypothetical protein
VLIKVDCPHCKGKVSIEIHKIDKLEKRIKELEGMLNLKGNSNTKSEEESLDYLMNMFNMK